MANVVQNKEEVSENLRKQLAVAVRSIQWSYAIFWSLSTTKHGALNWGNGYYNGDIKTRKTFQAMVLKADKMGLQRSEQLKELYESLLEGESESETELQSKQPSPALSPEDLSDAEWYYLVCMSFVFNPGQDLPGRALANNQTIWLCNAQYADSKVFSRSLLAKSASIQTIVCFPYLGGVIELGVTDLVLEDPNLIQHIKASLLDFSKPVCSDKSSSAHNGDDDKDPMCAIVGCDIAADTIVLENVYTATEEIRFNQEGINGLQGNIHEEFDIASPFDCSNGSEHNHQTEDSFMLGGLNSGVSQTQSWHFIDNDFSNGVQGSISSSDCVSQVIVNEDKVTTSSKVCNVNNLHLKQLQECNDTKFSSLDLGTNDDLHYKRIISTVLGNSHHLAGNLLLQGCNCKSSFVRWKKTGITNLHKPQTQQGILKKLLFTVPLMHGDWSKKDNRGKNSIWKEDKNDACIHPLSPDKLRENEKLMVLRSMVPSISKIDKAAILNDTIKYVQELEAKVEELESSIDLAEFEARVRRNNPDIVEHTSDNNDNRKIENGKKPWLNKRKACDIDEIDDLQSDMKISIKEQEVLIELRCAWREYLLLEIIEAINNLQLDAHCVQTSTHDGILNVAVSSKFRGAAVTSAGMIKQALLKVTGKS